MSHDDTDLVNQLRADLDHLVGDAGQTEPPPAPSITVQPPPRHRSGAPWTVIAAAAAVLVLVGGLIVIANRDTDDAPAATVPVTLSGMPVTVAPTVPLTLPATSAPGVPGIKYEAIGTVIDDGSTQMLCYSVLLSLPPQCDVGVLLSGWSWDAIGGGQSQSGVTWGDAYVRGVSDFAASGSNTFVVLDARIPTADDTARLKTSPELDLSVPCPEPEVGWPARNQEWPEADIRAIEGYAGSWEGGDGQVIVAKFTGDLEIAEAAVRQFYNDAICVVPAQHSLNELEAIQTQLLSMSSVQFLGASIRVDADGESVDAQIVGPNPDVQASLDAEFGQGVVRLSSLFQPLGVDTSTTSVSAAEAILGADLPIAALERDEPTYASLADLAAASDTIIVGTVDSVESIGRVNAADDPNASEYFLVEVRPQNVVRGDASEPIRFVWEGFVTAGPDIRSHRIVQDGVSMPDVGDQLLLFLVTDDPERVAFFGNVAGQTVNTLDGILYVEDGTVVTQLDPAASPDSPALALNGVGLDAVITQLAAE